MDEVPLTDRRYSYLNPLEHFEVVDLLGQGSFGNVVKIRHIETDDIYAAKQIILTEKSRRRSEREMQIMEMCSGHPNTLEFYGAFIDFTKTKSGCLWLVMENCDGGSIKSVLLEMSQRSFQEHWIRYIMKSVLKAVAFLHSKLIIHRDIKADNIMFTFGGFVKLVDFGLSVQLSSPSKKITTLVGTVPWMSPETMMCSFPERKSWYNTKADIWSLGITIFEMATGNAPWLVNKSMIKLVVDKSPPKLSSERSKELRHFTKRCLTRKPNHRPTAEKLLKDDFFTKFDTDGDALFEIRRAINLIDEGVSSPDLMIRSSVQADDQQRKPSKYQCVIS